jgi:hypothetical protein
VNSIAVFLWWIWSVVTFIPRWAWSKLFKKQPALYRASQVEEFPDSLKPLTVYLAGELGNLWAAAMLCPCGCGEKIELNLLKQVRPCWSAEQHADRSITLMPSVWRQKGCRSHFFVRRGRIDWC